MNVNNLMSTGVSLMVLTLLIVYVIIPLISGAEFPEDYKIVGTIVNLIPMFLAIGGLLTITNMFTNRS